MENKYKYLIVIFLVVASFIAYSQILGNGFINVDDNAYITENIHIQSGINLESIKWAFTDVKVTYWHPLTKLSHTLDWSLFGANASGHHLINILLHIGSVLFLFFFLNITTKNLWSSAFVAALFALHPLRVESVAWAAERKDVLSMFFGLASIYAYACYADSFKLSQYYLCLILFALSLMSKPMLVTLPFVLLLLDYWPLGRWQKVISAPVKSRIYLIGRLLWEKAPFVFLTIGSLIVTLWAHIKAGAVNQFPFPFRVVNAVHSYVSYLWKIFWPVDLAVLYPYEYSFPLWQVLVYCFILIGITIVVIYTIKKLPFLFVGWFWYLGTLIPEIGLVSAGPQAMADRFTYLPSIGIAIMLIWGIPLLFQRADIRKKILFPVGIAVLVILAVLTWQQSCYWENSIELWNHTLQVTKNNYFAHKNLGLALFTEGKFGEAIEHYNETIRITPDYAIDYNDRGAAYANLGQHQRAIQDYSKAIRLQPDYVNAYYHRGLAYNELGQYQLAIEDFNKAISIVPYYARAYNNRGFSYDKLGQYELAIEDFNKAISIVPYYAKAYSNRGNAYLSHGNKKLGCNDAQKACELGNCDTLNTAKDRGYCR